VAGESVDEKQGVIFDEKQGVIFDEKQAHVAGFLVRLASVW
jgi:hypothetical protein